MLQNNAEYDGWKDVILGKRIAVQGTRPVHSITEVPPRLAPFLNEGPKGQYGITGVVLGVVVFQGPDGTIEIQVEAGKEPLVLHKNQILRVLCDDEPLPTMWSDGLPILNYGPGTL